MPDPLVAMTPLELVLYFNHGYVNSFADGLWGIMGKRGRGLRFTYGGIARLASVFGYIEGLHRAGQTLLAEAIAKEIVGHFDAYATYGGSLPVAPNDPQWIIEFGDDGTWHGWSMMYYRAVPATPEVLALKNTLRDPRGAIVIPSHVTTDGQAYCYVFSHNGALLYHGPGGDNVLAIDLASKPHFWSGHT